VLAWCTLLIALDRSFRVFRYPLENVFVTMSDTKVDAAREYLLGTLELPSVMILGSSHGQFGIDPEALCGEGVDREDVYNFAFGGGMDTRTQLQLLQKLLERAAPERVIYGVDVFSLNRLSEAGRGRVHKMLSGNNARDLTVADLASLAGPESTEGARFGSALAFSDGRVFVGAPSSSAPGGEGTALVFEQEETGWAVAARLVPPNDARCSARFGVSVALDGDTAVVGAPPAEKDGDGGEAYVFQRVGDTWQEPVRLPAGGAAFGSAVGVSGGVLLVGAPADGAGAVSTFVHDGTAWHPDHGLRPEDGESGDLFGAALAIDASREVTRAVIGAPLVDAGARNTGCAYVFARGTGGWRLEARLAPSDLPRDAFFGIDVAISGERVLVGTRAGGEAFVYVLAPGGWTQEAALTPIGREVPVGPVALDGDSAWVSISRPGRHPRSVVGFRRAGSWHRRGRFALEGAAAADRFGAALAADAGRVAIGAPYASDACVTVLEPAELPVDGAGEFEDSVWERLPRVSRAFLYRGFFRRYLGELLEGETTLPTWRAAERDLRMFSTFETYEVSRLGHVSAVGEANVDYVRRSTFEFDPAEESVNALERLIRITAKAGARLDLVHIPEHAACHANARAYEEFAAYMADFVERTGVSYHDFNRPDAFPIERTELFLDTDHLNADGAMLFSELLGERLGLRNADD